MFNSPENVTVQFDDEGKSFTDILEQVFKIILKQAEEGEGGCNRKQ